VGSQVQVLPDPPRNKKVRGGIAQLGEHLLCKQGVVGSIPSASTTHPSKAIPSTPSLFDGRDHDRHGLSHKISFVIFNKLEAEINNHHDEGKRWSAKAIHE
jgi:hypothetical protein